jgi:hypothetical protein
MVQMAGLPHRLHRRISVAMEQCAGIVVRRSSRVARRSPLACPYPPFMTASGGTDYREAGDRPHTAASKFWRWLRVSAWTLFGASLRCSSTSCSRNLDVTMAIPSSACEGVLPGGHRSCIRSWSIGRRRTGATRECEPCTARDSRCAHSRRGRWRRCPISPFSQRVRMHPV